MKPATTVTRGARISTGGISAGPGRRVWQTIAVLSVAALSWWYYAAHQQPAADRHRALVVSFGWIGTSLSLAATALSIRKRLMYQGAGKLYDWVSAHTYLGVIAAFAIFYHCGLRMGGPLTAWLLAFFCLTIVSGLMGWWLSRTIPPLLTALEENPAIIEELQSARSECLRGMLELAAAGSPDFSALVERRLMKEAGSWTRMLRFYRRQSTLAQELPQFQRDYERDLRHLKPPEQRAFHRAAEYALRANKMNAELLLQRVLRGWLTLHTANTAAMFGLAAMHIFSVLYYRHP